MCTFQCESAVVVLRVSGPHPAVATSRMFGCWRCCSACPLAAEPASDGMILQTPAQSHCAGCAGHVSTLEARYQTVLPRACGRTARARCARGWRGLRRHRRSRNDPRAASRHPVRPARAAGPGYAAPAELTHLSGNAVFQAKQSFLVANTLHPLRFDDGEVWRWLTNAPQMRARSAERDATACSG